VEDPGQIGFGLAVAFVGFVDAALMDTGVQADVVPHVFVAATQTFPALPPADVFMESVPCPELMVQPAGTVQL
jgi:hypothetical protein